MRGFNFVPIRSNAYFSEWKSALNVLFMQGKKQLVRVTWKTVFDAKSPGRRLWQDLHEDGLLSSNPGNKDVMLSGNFFCMSRIVVVKSVQTQNLFSVSLKIAFDLTSFSSLYS